MASPPPARQPGGPARRLSRRDVVRAAAATAGVGAVSPVLAACAAHVPAAARHDARASTGGGSDDPDVSLLTAAIHDENRLLALAAATLRAHRSLASSVRPVVTRQRAHVRQLAASLTEAPDLSRGRPPEVAHAVKAAVADLLDATSAAEQARLGDCLDATSGLLARLLASVSASHATTVETLRVTR